MQQELVAGLADLTCPQEEACSLLIADLVDAPGIAVLLKRQKSARAVNPWIKDHDPKAGTYLYNALFESESAAEIIRSIKDLMEFP